MTPTTRCTKPLLEPLEPRRLFAVAGALDPSFSGDGKVTLATGEVLSAADVAVQQDGKTVVVGSAQSAFPGDDRYFLTARFNVDGTLDQTFGNGGVVRTQLSDLDDSHATAVAIQPDGKIVVVGEAEVSGGFDERELAAARYNPNGTLDNTFDDNGVLSRDLSGIKLPTSVVDVAIQPNGQIVIVGDASPGSIDTAPDFYAAFFGANGAFRTVKHVGFSTFGFHKAGGATLDNLGHIFITGRIFDDDTTTTALLRLTTFEIPPEIGGGIITSVDFKTSFSLPGRTKTEGQEVFIQPDGKIVVAGNTPGLNGQNDFFVARFTAAGDLDTTFGQSGPGFTVTDVGSDDRVGDIIATPTGGGGGFIVSGNSSGMAAVKYTDNGALDTSFGTGGKVRLFIGGTASIAPGPGRRVVLAGGSAFATARILLNGAREVSVAAIDSSSVEGSPNTGSLFVGRNERLPFATRVFFSIAGTASISSTRTSPRDWSMPGMVLTVLTPTVANGYVDIPANETFVILTFTTINDSMAESTESSTFSIASNINYEIGSPAAGTIKITDDDMFNPNPGTSTATIPPKHVGVGEELQAAVTWTVPTGGWRQLSTIQLRLRDIHDDDALAILTFDESTNSFSVESTPGIGPSPISLVLSKCTFQAAGPTAPTVTVIFSFRFNPAAANQRFALDVAASNDTGAFSGFAQVGELHVHKKPSGDALAPPV